MAKTTLVILTYNRRAQLLRTVESSLALPERPPVIVVDNASGDGSAAAVRRAFPAARVVDAGRNRGAAARNLGAHAAATPHVAFSDDDTTWCAGSIARGEALLDAHPRIAALTARVLVGARREIDPACAIMAASPLPREDLPGPSLLGFLAGAVLFRRDAFLALGGYEERFFIGGEEALLALDLVAAGWRVVYADDMAVVHEPSALRDPAARDMHLARNALWVAWMRRPARVAGLLTWLALRDAQGRQALRLAVRGLPWVLARRRMLPRDVEAWRRRLDGIERQVQQTPTMGVATGLPHAEKATVPAHSPAGSRLTASGR
ncbi:MAG TPA: glycosyltransferase [Usitatibacter sp.]|nr:glycosyltransferase [Usitatibacter sp.]